PISLMEMLPLNEPVRENSDEHAESRSAVCTGTADANAAPVSGPVAAATDASDTTRGQIGGPISDEPGDAAVLASGAIGAAGWGHGGGRLGNSRSTCHGDDHHRGPEHPPAARGRTITVKDGHDSILQKRSLNHGQRRHC